MAGEGGGKSDEDVYEILIMNDCLRKIPCHPTGRCAVLTDLQSLLDCQ